MSATVASAPNLEQLKKQAKELLRAFRAHDVTAAERVVRSHPEFDRNTAPTVAMRRVIRLADAQLVIARENEFASWPRLKQDVERRVRELGGGVHQPLRRARRHTGEGRVWLDDVPALGWGSGRECTFAGALASATAATEHPVSYADVMGLSGLSFRTRWFQGNDAPDCCPSSPVGEFPEEIAAISRATGWMTWVGSKLGDEERSMAPYFPEIASSIDDGLPVLAYTERMDVCVLYGYSETGERVLARTYDQTDSPAEIATSELGPWIAILDDRSEALTPPSAFSESLRIAVSNFRRGDAVPQGTGHYWYGASALRSWADDIRAASEDQGDEYVRKLFRTSWWVFDSLFDARQAAVSYLREHADLLGERAAPLLREAASAYDAEVGLLSRTFSERDVFLGPWTGKTMEEWTGDVRENEQALLQSAITLEENAVALIEAALAAAE